MVLRYHVERHRIIIIADKVVTPFCILTQEKTPICDGYAHVRTYVQTAEADNIVALQDNLTDQVIKPHTSILARVYTNFVACADWKPSTKLCTHIMEAIHKTMHPRKFRSGYYAMVKHGLPQICIRTNMKFA